MLRDSIIIACLGAVMGVAPAGAAGQFAVSGYFKNFSIVADPAQYSSPGSPASAPLTGSVSNRLRIDAGWFASGSVSFELAYDFIPRIQDAARPGSRPVPLAPDPLTYRIADLERMPYPASADDVRTVSIVQNLDRAVLSVGTAFADLSLGRQAIAWGSARVINPTDVFAPFAFSELDIEDRTGIDALRVRIPTGMMGEIDLGYVCGKDARLEESAIYARSKFYAAKTDITLVAADFREHLMAGVDLARSIGGAGAWIECAVVFVDAFSRSRREHTRNYAGATCGLDYNLTGALYGFCEYHFNTSGTSENGAYLENGTGPAYRDGGAYLLGTHYLAPGILFQMSPLATFNASALWNLTDASLLVAPRLEYNLSEDVYLEAGCYLGVGDRAALSPGGGAEGRILPESEFGLYADIYFTSFRIYF